MTTVSNDDFARAVRNTMEVLRKLADAIEATPEQHGRKPAETSIAKTEIGHQEGYSKRCDWQHPVEDTYSTSHFALEAACDHARSFVALFEGNHVSVYTHMTVARVLLEACTVAWWLDDPKIKTHERVQRGLSEQLYSAHQLAYLNMPGDDNAGRELFWQGVAKQLGWTVSEGWGGKQAVNSVCRPNVETAIDQLLESDQRKMGHKLYCLFSAVTHATCYGLIQGVVERKDQGNGMATVGIGSQSVSVESQAWISIMALRRTAQRRFELMGWEDGDWQMVAQRTRQYELGLAAKLLRQQNVI